MKRILLPALLIILWTVRADAQHSHKQKNTVAKWIVPAVVEQKFVVENPEATATWRKDGKLYVAQFVNPVNNLGYVLVYDSTGHVVRREKELENPDMPGSIHDFFASRFPGEPFMVWSSTDSSGNFSYYSSRNGQTLRFDKDGRYIDPAVKARLADTALRIRPR